MMDTRFFAALAIVSVGGALIGSHLGYAASATYYTLMLSDCQGAYGTLPDACRAASTVCRWNATDTYARGNASSQGTCLYKDQTMPCSLGGDSEDRCDNLPECRFRDERCEHLPPWSAEEQGSFVAGSYIGSMTGSLTTGLLLQRLSHRTVLRLAGILGLLSACFLTLGWNTPSPSTHQLNTVKWLFVGRLLGGLGNGMTKVAAPLFGALIATPKQRDPVIFTHQFANGVGGFSIALSAFLLHRWTPTGALYDTFNLLHFFLGGIAVTQIVCSALADPAHDDSKAATAMTPLLKQGEGEAMSPAAAPVAVKIEADNNPIKPLWFAYVVAFMLAVGVQFSGAQVSMNFAPALAKRMGMAPLTGFVVLMAWNMIASGIAIFVRRCGFTSFNMMLMGLAASFVSALFSGCATAPWIFSNPESDTAFFLMTLGLVGGITAFRVFLLPSFSVLIQRIFPPESRAMGTAAGTSFHYGCTLATVGMFPLAVETLSYSSDSRTGQSLVFFIFALVSCGCAVGTFTFLRQVT